MILLNVEWGPIKGKYNLKNSTLNTKKEILSEIGNYLTQHFHDNLNVNGINLMLVSSLKMKSLHDSH